MNTGMPQNQPPRGQPQPPMPPQGQYQGAQQQPYYGPPPKSNTGKIVIIILAVVLGGPMLIGILAVAAIPLISSNTRDAKRAEGDAVAAMVKTELRALWSKSGKIPSRSDAKVAEILARAVGEYIASVEYEGLPRSGDSRFSQGGSGKITVTMKSSTDGVLVLEFDYQSGVPVSDEWTP